MKSVEYLQSVGFGVYESQMLDVLLRIESPTAKDIAQISLVPKNKVYELLEKLHKDGVIEVLPTKPKRFRLLDLEKSILQLKRKQESKHDDAFSHIQQILKSKKSEPDLEKEVWVTEGEKAMLTRIQKVLKSTQKESIGFVDVWAGSDIHYKSVEAAIGRGVKFYFLGPADKKYKKIIKKYLSLGVEIREFPVETAGYSIFDSQEVQMRVSSGKLVSLWIKNKYLATMLREHFFQNWKKSKKINF
ncbi:hypothetical protein N9L26_02535 [Candidatus Pacebacteria bacterium]|nr:hypothetical protein [Candidatus Paceibacterota bacterium]